MNRLKDNIKLYLITKQPCIYCRVIQFKTLVCTSTKYFQNKLKIQIEMLLRHKYTVFFIQIGSNDGLLNDPLHELILANTNWRGIFVEPVKLYFDQLKRSYNNSSRFIFENVAIGLEGGINDFYYVPDTVQKLFKGSLPYWYKGLGSFDKNHIIKHLNGILAPYIISIRCQCLTLQNIIDKYNVNHVDLLHIDTEGFDYKILCQIDFSKFKPYIIAYEHKHLHPEEKQGAEILLMDNGYSLTQYGEDTLAVLKG